MDVFLHVRSDVVNVSDDSYFMGGVVGEGLDRYLPPIYLVLGSICNVLAVLVLRTKYFCFYSSASYMIGGAVMDQINLSQALLTRWLWVNTPSIFSQGWLFPYLCKAYNYLGAVSSDLCGVIIVTAVVERSIAVTFPRKSRKLCTVRKARLSLWALSFLCLLKNSLLVHTVQSQTDSKLQLCKNQASTKSLTYLVTLILPIVHHIIIFLGYVLIVVCSVVILRCPRSAYVVLAQRLNTKRRRRSAREVLVTCECHLSRMVVTDGLVHLALSSLINAYLFLDDFSLIDPSIPSPKHLHPIFFFLAFYLLYLDRCISFLLYLKCGSRFRHAVKMEFCADTGSYERNTFVTFSGVRMIRDIDPRASPTTPSEVETLELSKTPSPDSRSLEFESESDSASEQAGEHPLREWPPDRAALAHADHSDTTLSSSSSDPSMESHRGVRGSNLGRYRRYSASLPDDWGHTRDVNDDDEEEGDDDADESCLREKGSSLQVSLDRRASSETDCLKISLRRSLSDCEIERVFAEYRDRALEARQCASQTNTRDHP